MIPSPVYTLTSMSSWLPVHGMKPAYSACSGMILIGVARALNGHVTVDFLANESRFHVL
jgi:hypothetical protein